MPRSYHWRATRRLVLAVAGGALLAFGARAQPEKRRRIGYLTTRSRASNAPLFRAFREGLRALGYSDDDIEIEARYADDHLERLNDLAAELVRLAPEVVVAASPETVRALKQVTSTIPIVMAASGDPVAVGFVASLGHPGGNVTGLSTVSQDLVGKWVELLKTVSPSAERIAFLLNPANPVYPVVLQSAQQAARSLRIQLLPLDARSPAEIEGAFSAMQREHADALIGWGDPLFLTEKGRIVEFATS